LVDAVHEPRTRGLRCSYNKEWRGSSAVDSLVWCTVDLTISGQSGTPTTCEDLPSPSPAAENPNGSGSGSPPPRLSPLGNRFIRRMIWLPSSTQTQPISSHPGVVTDSHPSETQPISSHPDPADITNKPVWYYRFISTGIDKPVGKLYYS
jgi:hypothetical protein